MHRWLLEWLKTFTFIKLLIILAYIIQTINKFLLYCVFVFLCMRVDPLADLIVAENKSAASKYNLIWKSHFCTIDDFNQKFACSLLTLFYLFDKWYLYSLWRFCIYFQSAIKINRKNKSRQIESIVWFEKNN